LLSIWEGEIEMIRIAASDPNKKGRIFENFVKKMLEGQGYYDFRTVKKTGRQIDIFAKHKVTDQPIICECKAYETKLNGNHLTKFRGLYDHEYDTNKSLIGLFFSLSGFGDGLIEYYDEIDKKVKKRLKIFSDKDIFTFIVDSNIVESTDVITHIIRNKLPYDIEHQYLSVSEHGEYWISIFGIGGKETHFTILSAKGDEVQKYIIDELMNVDTQIKKLIPINLNVRTKIILNLTDNKIKTIKEISNEITESTIDIKMALLNLINEDTIRKSGKRYRINNELETFILMSKEFLSSKYRNEYFRSAYVQGMIDERLINYLQTRFYIKFDVDHKEGLVKLLQISPSALLQSLIYPTGPYKKGYEQISKKGTPKKAMKKLMQSSQTSLMMMLMKFLISDLDKDGHIDILADKNIRGYYIQIETKFASLENLILHLNFNSTIMAMKAAGRIEAGQLVSPTTLGAYIDIANLYIQLENLDKALEAYDIIIEYSTDKELLKTAWNNRGLVFAMKADFNIAIDCYKKSIIYDNKLKEPYYNLGRAYLSLNDKQNAKKYFKKALKIDKNYKEAKEFLKNLDL
jgi:tetratricopeptide (TPR) repeat protein